MFTNSVAKTVKVSANELRTTLSACLSDVRAVMCCALKDEVTEDLKVAKKAKDTKRVTELSRMLIRAEEVKATPELVEAVGKIVESGLGLSDVTPKYIVEHLKGTDYVNEEGRIMRKNAKKEWVERTEWTIGVALDLLRRANANHCKSLGL